MSDDPNSSVPVSIKKLEGMIQALSEGHAKTLSGIEGLRNDVPRLIEIATGRLDRIEAGQGKIRSEIMGRIDRLQETVELVREDARVNWATADTAMSRIKNSRDDMDRLTTLISAMEQRYQKLAAVVDELRSRNGKKPDSL